jgi:ADP-ribose pyrophosphatase YjhB (NUDIX family)
LAVQSHRGKWTAPKGHRKIKDDYQLETIKETATRKFNEEIRVKNRITGETYSFYDFGKEHALNVSKYVERRIDDKYWGKNGRCIGLFIIKIDESKLEFSLPDTYENQVIQILILILSNITKYSNNSIVDLYMVRNKLHY